MPVGTLVTDAMITGLTRITSSELTGERAKLIVRSAEEAVKRWCDREFLEASVVDESIDIQPGQIISYGIPVVRRLVFRVKRYPISAWTTLKMVTELDPVTGLPYETSTVARNSYYVNNARGEITLLDNLTNSLFNSGMSSMDSWPTGVNVMLATYTAGYPIANMPPDIQEIVCRVVARIWHQYDTQGFNASGLSGEMGTVQYINTRLTADEKNDLRPYRRWSMG